MNALGLAKSGNACEDPGLRRNARLTGQVSRWHLRMTTSWRHQRRGCLESEPPREHAPTTTSWPGSCSPPIDLHRDMAAQPLCTGCRRVSARPISQASGTGQRGERAPPVPPSNPAIVTWSERALLTRQQRCRRRPRDELHRSPRRGLAFFRSWISCGEILDRVDGVMRRG